MKLVMSPIIVWLILLTGQWALKSVQWILWTLDSIHWTHTLTSLHPMGLQFWCANIIISHCSVYKYLVMTSQIKKAWGWSAGWWCWRAPPPPRSSPRTWWNRPMLSFREFLPIATMVFLSNIQQRNVQCSRLVHCKKSFSQSQLCWKLILNQMKANNYSHKSIITPTASPSIRQLPDNNKDWEENLQVQVNPNVQH